MNVDILEGLNPAQRRAVEVPSGPLLIVAGPGSGKTRVITHRIAYLCAVHHVPPYRIMAVTFTNKAANEMRSRLGLLMGPAAADLTAGTFHAICARVLRRDGTLVGLPPGFTIFDDDDQMAVVKRAMDEAQIDAKRYPPRAMLSAISRAKNRLLTASAFAEQVKEYYEEVVARVYKQYEAALDKANAVDFDDLLLKVYFLFQTAPDTLRRYQNRYLHVLVDEFQDTNAVQYAIARMVAAEHRNICVVGDPDQSIYSWRSADIRNILSFTREHYPEAATVVLDQNYRSTTPIVEAARALIQPNTQRLDKPLTSVKGAGSLLVVHEAYTEEEEAQFVLKEVERLVRNHEAALGECAVLYRVNAQSRAFEETCVRHGVPYRLVGGLRFYQRREVRDIIAYLRLISNPNDDVSLTRVINAPPRGIGPKTIQDLAAWGRSQDLSLAAAVDLVGQQRDAGTAVTHPLPPRAASQVAAFARMLGGLRARSKELPVADLLDLVVEQTGYRNFVMDQEGGAERWENVRELRGVAESYREAPPEDGLNALLEQVALVSDVDRMEEGANALTLITLHQAKGLEFQVVFLVGMEEGLLPHSRSLDNPLSLEEERRLAYVGVTRAKDRLYLVRAFRRRMMGGSMPTIPSRFLQDIPTELVQSIAAPKGQAKPPRRTGDDWGPESQEPAARRFAPGGSGHAAPPTTVVRRAVGKPGPSALPLRDGERVTHAKFGQGVVVSVKPVGTDYEVMVAFSGEAGVKRLLASFAKLEKAE